MIPRRHPRRLAELPEGFRDPAVLAYIAAITAWREGDEIPPMPNGVTKESLPGLLVQLNDPAVSKAVALELSKLIPHPKRKLERSR